MCPKNNNIYCIPCNAEHVLKVNIEEGTCSLIGQQLLGKQKWYGGILGDDGCIYGIPMCSTKVLKVNPATDEVELIGDLSDKPWKWHGGCASNGPEKAIYGFPSHSDTVLKIIPDTGKVTEIGDLSNYEQVMPIGRFNDGKYKYGGGVCDPLTGNVYCFPSDADKVVKIDCRSDKVELIGGSLEDVYPEEALKAGFYNKWQNGFVGLDDCLYSIPCNANRVLKIDPTTDEVFIFGGPFEGCEKWEGGVVGKDNHLYCMPNDGQTILKIHPSKKK